MSSLKNKVCLAIARTFPKNSFRIKFLRFAGNIVGEKVYLGPSTTIICDSSYPDVKLKIGDRVSLAPNITFILVSGANNSILSEKIPWIAGSIELEDDCWIGTGVIIYPGIKIGKASVALAGAVITKDVPPYTIVGGVPAKVIKTIEI